MLQPTRTASQTIEETHGSYDAAITMVLEHMAKGNRAEVMIATHNQASIEHAIALMQKLGIRRQDGVSFGQLLGMADNSTFPLGTGGYKVRRARQSERERERKKEQKRERTNGVCGNVVGTCCIGDWSQSENRSPREQGAEELRTEGPASAPSLGSMPMPMWDILLSRVIVGARFWGWLTGTNALEISAGPGP